MSIQQQKLFFLLSDKLGYNKEELKNNAKLKYGKSHFYDLTSEEIAPLITILEKEAKAAGIELTVEKKIKPLHRETDFPNEWRVWDRQENVMLYGQNVLGLLDYNLLPNDPRYIAMQWTGLRDKTDERIFDFDIVKSHL